MFHFVRKGFIHLLDSEVDWMDANTKLYARRKAEAIFPYVGYNPHLYQNKTYLEEISEKVFEISELFVIRLCRFEKQQKKMRS